MRRVLPAIQTPSALEEAHSRGILHRDLETGQHHADNRRSGKACSTSVLPKMDDPAPACDAFSTLTVGLTEPGAVVGTLAYMSPEQAQGHAVDARSDIFSFGLVLYLMVSGRRAFSGGTPFALMTALVKETHCRSMRLPQWNES